MVVLAAPTLCPAACAALCWAVPPGACAAAESSCGGVCCDAAPRAASPSGAALELLCDVHSACLPPGDPLVRDGLWSRLQLRGLVLPDDGCGPAWPWWLSCSVGRARTCCFLPLSVPCAPAVMLQEHQHHNTFYICAVEMACCCTVGAGCRWSPRSPPMQHEHVQ